MDKRKWKRIVYNAVEAHDSASAIQNLASLSGDTAARFARCKNWAKVSEDFACFSGEIGRRGALVSEPYLDDRTEAVGRRLKLMCRTGCLPVLKRVVREEGLPAESGTCKMCGSGEVESISHLIVSCNGYSELRSNALATILTRLKGPMPSGDNLLCLLLGASTGIPSIDVFIDRVVKRFLKKAWRHRKWLLRETNLLFDRTDTPWAT
jgi:hypothetical protein